MRKNTWISLALLTGLLVAGFFILQSAAPTAPIKPIQKEEQVLCSKINNSACAPAKTPSAPGEMLVESLSRQFLSIPSLIR